MLKSITLIGKEANLNDYFTLIDQPGQFEHSLVVIANFVRGRRDLDNVGIEGNIEDRLFPLTRKVVDYATALVTTYDTSNPFDLLHTTLRALVYLPEEDKGHYIDVLKGFAETESDGANKEYVLPLIIDVVLKRLVEKYAAKFDGIGKGDPIYTPLSGELKTDLTTLVEYARLKLEQNSRFELNAKKISFEACFPDSEDIKGACSEYFFGLASTGADPSDAISKYNIIGMDIKRPRHADRNSVVIYVGGRNKGGSQKYNRVVVDFPDGLTARQAEFFLLLSTRIQPDPAHAVSTRKCRDFLAKRQFI